MSRIYFHSEHGEAEVSGAERAYMGGVCGDLFIVGLGLDHDHDSRAIPSPIRTLLNPKHYAADPCFEGRRFSDTLSTALRVGFENDILITDGKPVNTFAASLNTAYVMGSDAVKLMARLHGQCELHAYVEGANRAWLASIIERGLAAAMFRSGMGWESVVELLRSRADSPVVTSFSGSHEFPNRHLAAWTPPTVRDADSGEEYEDADAWYDLAETERWHMAIEGLRRQGNGLELKPDDWASFYFADGVNGFQLRRIAEKRSEALVG